MVIERSFSSAIDHSPLPYLVHVQHSNTTHYCSLVVTVYSLPPLIYLTMGLFTSSTGQPSNIHCMSCTFETSHPPIGRLNAAAFKNMPSMFCTLETSHPPMGWLNALAPPNMYRVISTLETYHPPIGWLNAAAFLSKPHFLTRAKKTN